MKYFISLLLVFLITLSGVSAFAANPATIPVWDHDIYVEGNLVDCLDAAGQRLCPLSYNGSIYVPLRAAAEWMGKDVAKSADGKTFSLSGDKDPVAHDKVISGETPASTAAITVLAGAQLRLDGDAIALTDALGNTVDMIDCGGEPYLPVRSVASALGMSLKYNNDAIYMRAPLTDEQLEACKAYADALSGASEQYTKLFGADQAYVKNLSQLSTAAQSIELSRGYAQTLKSEKRPDCELLTGYYAELDELADEVLKGCDFAEQLIQTNAPLEQVRSVMMLQGRLGEGAEHSVMDSSLNMVLVSRKINKVVYET